MRSNTPPSSSHLVLLSQKTSQLVRHDLSLVDPKLAMPSHYLLFLMPTYGFLHDLSIGGRSEADQPVVLWIVLLAGFEDECKICLSPASLGISPSLMAFQRWQKVAS